MRDPLAFAAVVAAVIGVTVAGLGMADRKPSIMFVGDSLTYGATSGPATGGYRRIASEGFTTVGTRHDSAGGHEGHRGWSAIDLATRSPYWIERYRPSKVIIMAGTNDLLRGHRPEEAVFNVLALVDTAEDRPTYVLTIPPIDAGKWHVSREYVARFNSMLIEKGHEQYPTVHFVDTRGMLSDADLCADRIHLSPEGYDKLGRAVRDALSCSGPSSYRPR